IAARSDNALHWYREAMTQLDELIFVDTHKARRLPLRYFFFSSRRRHTRSVSAFLLNRSSDLLLLLVYELNRSGLLAENEKIRPILAQLEKLLLCDLSPSTNDSVKN